MVEVKAGLRPGGSRVSESVREAFWEAVRSGLSPTAAATVVGVHGATGRKWARDAGYQTNTKHFGIRYAKAPRPPNNRLRLVRFSTSRSPTAKSHPPTRRCKPKWANRSRCTSPAMRPTSCTCTRRPITNSRSRQHRTRHSSSPLTSPVRWKWSCITSIAGWPPSKFVRDLPTVRWADR